MNRWNSRRYLLSASVVAAALLLAPVSSLSSQVRVTTPKEHFGFQIGDDYHLATYTQFQSYWAKLDAESDRMVVQEIGKTAEGRPQLMAIITSPENQRNLARYKEISRRLALAEGLTDEQARQLAREGKAVVWFDGGLHATEVLGAHQLIETVYRLVSSTDPEVIRFLNDLIILAVHANPDGMELVSNWYMREPDPTKRSTSGIPRLYQKYIGHDNNRDFYMVAMPETENMTRIMFHEWFPQIVYNHHQTGPAGAVLFAPPFRDPFNYFYDPLVPIGIEAVGAAMHQRFIAEGKPGATMRSGASYSTWWNGGLRTTTYFHNMIGLLTETIGNPTPVEIPFVPDMLLPRNDLPFPIAPQKWHFRQSIEYSVTANYAVFDYASKHREELLYNFYRMGRNSIERGSRDHWTITPKRIAMVEEAARQAGLSGQQARGRRALPDSLFALLRRPELRDPRGYIIPSDQPDFPTAVKFVNALIKNGITVHRATQSFTVSGKQYPAGSLVIKTAQAFRPHILDMFEPQDHPNDFRYPGGPPIPPYDNAGWTLAYQMGVQFDRILDGFEGPFEKIEGLAKVPSGTVAGADRAAGFLLSHQVNDAFIATNRLLKAGHEVYWLTEPHQANGKTYPAGTIFIPARSGVLAILRDAASQLGLKFEGTPTAPSGELLKMKQVRIGLWDRYGGSMPSGWTRWLLEQFEFPFEVVYPQTLDAGNLIRRFDVLIFPTEAIPGWDERGAGFGGFGSQIDPQRIPQEYRSWLGSVTREKTIPQLMHFLNEGGTIIAIGSSVAMGKHAGLPIVNHLVDASGRPLPEEKLYVPGSILRVRVDNTRPIAYGLPEQVDVFFDNSPVMRLLPEASARGVRRVAWFDSAEPLRSGWAWGQENLKDGVAAVEAQVGRGKLFLFGPEILNRGQPHGTFKFFFNGIYLAGASGVRAAAGSGR
jgi:hypothetical protein